MQINILGFGNMGQAIAKILINNKFKAKIYASDRRLVTMHGVVFDAKFECLSGSDFVIIGVKPQDIEDLAHDIRGLIKPNVVIISIAAGVNLKKLAAVFNHQKIVRMMPNLGILVGQGIAAWKAAGLSPEDKKQVVRLLNAICDNFEVTDEKMIDAVTAISGSGPAYFFAFADGLKQAGRNLGLGQEQLQLLVEKTFMGAALLQQGQDYQELIKKVRSKKGTTDAALNIFAEKGMKKIISDAVKAAYTRAKQLSKG